MTEAVSNTRSMVGEVISNAADKTIVVLVGRTIKHPKYGKYLQRSTKLHAHDEDNACQMGDMVMIKESRPLSKKKTWVLEKIVEQKEQA